MEKITKILNIALIFTLIGIFLCQDLVYAETCHDGKLRLWMKFGKDSDGQRMEKAALSLRRIDPFGSNLPIHVSRKLTKPEMKILLSAMKVEVDYLTEEKLTKLRLLKDKNKMAAIGLMKRLGYNDSAKALEEVTVIVMPANANAFSPLLKTIWSITEKKGIFQRIALYPFRMRYEGKNYIFIFKNSLLNYSLYYQTRALETYRDEECKAFAENLLIAELRERIGKEYKDDIIYSIMRTKEAVLDAMGIIVDHHYIYFRSREFYDFVVNREWRKAMKLLNRSEKPVKEMGMFDRIEPADKGPGIFITNALLILEALDKGEVVKAQKRLPTFIAQIKKYIQVYKEDEKIYGIKSERVIEAALDELRSILGEERAFLANIFDGESKETIEEAAERIYRSFLVRHPEDAIVGAWLNDNDLFEELSNYCEQECVDVKILNIVWSRLKKEADVQRIRSMVLEAGHLERFEAMMEEGVLTPQEIEILKETPGLLAFVVGAKDKAIFYSHVPRQVEDGLWETKMPKSDFKIASDICRKMGGARVAESRNALEDIIYRPGIAARTLLKNWAELEGKIDYERSRRGDLSREDLKRISDGNAKKDILKVMDNFIRSATASYNSFIIGLLLGIDLENVRFREEHEDEDHWGLHLRKGDIAITTPPEKEMTYVEEDSDNKSVKKVIPGNPAAILAAQRWFRYQLAAVQLGLDIIKEFETGHYEKNLRKFERNKSAVSI